MNKLDFVANENGTNVFSELDNMSGGDEVFSDFDSGEEMDGIDT